MWKVTQNKKQRRAIFLIKKIRKLFLLSELACAKCGFNQFLELLCFLKEDMCIWYAWSRLIRISSPSEVLDIKPYMGVQLEDEEIGTLENNSQRYKHLYKRPEFLIKILTETLISSFFSSPPTYIPSTLTVHVLRHKWKAY